MNTNSEPIGTVTKWVQGELFPTEPLTCEEILTKGVHLGNYPESLSAHRWDAIFFYEDKYWAVHVLADDSEDYPFSEIMADHPALPPEIKEMIAEHSGEHVTTVAWEKLNQGAIQTWFEMEITSPGELSLAQIEEAVAQYWTQKIGKELADRILTTTKIVRGKDNKYRAL